VVKELREKWLAANPGPDHYRRPGPIRFTGEAVDKKPLALMLNNLAEKK